MAAMTIPEVGTLTSPRSSGAYMLNESRSASPARFSTFQAAPLGGCSSFSTLFYLGDRDLDSSTPTRFGLRPRLSSSPSPKLPSFSALI